VRCAILDQHTVFFDPRGLRRGKQSAALKRENVPL
jgi:hypothetical protein